jgi:hypothetical protein
VMRVPSRLQVLGRFRLLAIVATIAGLMTPHFPSKGPEAGEPHASTVVAWDVPDAEQFDPLMWGDEEDFEFLADESTSTTETSESDGGSVTLAESDLGLFVAGIRRPISHPSPGFALTLSRIVSKSSPHARSGRAPSGLILDRPTRLCRLTC